MANGNARPEPDVAHHLVDHQRAGGSNDGADGADAISSPISKPSHCEPNCHEGNEGRLGELRHSPH
jgi:hypothetical protein